MFPERSPGSKSQAVGESSGRLLTQCSPSRGRCIYACAPILPHQRDKPFLISITVQATQCAARLCEPLQASQPSSTAASADGTNVIVPDLLHRKDAVINQVQAALQSSQRQVALLRGAISGKIDPPLHKNEARQAGGPRKSGRPSERGTFSLFKVCVADVYACAVNKIRML